MRKNKETRYRFAELIISNIYMISDLLDYEIEACDIWHSYNLEEAEHVENVLLKSNIN